MSLAQMWTSSVWRTLTALALMVGVFAPVLAGTGVSAQETLPATAAAAPESTVLFHSMDLDRDGAQWLQTEELLTRVGLPNALDLWEKDVLEKGAKKGDFAEADLDALLGGEIAVVLTPLAVQRMVEQQERERRRHDETAAAEATPVAHAWDEPQGATVILLPGDPDAAWDYVERQFADLAAKHDVPVEEVSHGGGELLWIETPDHRERLAEQLESALGDVELDEALGEWLGDAEMQGRPGFAAGRVGDFIVAGISQDDVMEIIDVVDGTTSSLADSTTAQQVAAGLPADALSFTYVNSPGILDAVGRRTVENLQAMMPEMDEASWQTSSGFAISAVESGFCVDAITVPGESGSLGSAAIANDPAVSAAAERVPSGTFLYQAGVVPENAFAGAAYMLALAVNGEMEGQEWENGGGMNQLPTEEEMAEEIATATATLGFDPQADLFALLGGEFIAFSSFPTFAMNGFGLDAVAAITTSDPDTLAETMRMIAAFIDRADSEADVSVRQQNGDTVYVVSDPETAEAPSLEFGVVGDQAVVGTQGGIEALGTEPTSSLAGDAQYQDVMSSLPSEFYQVTYVDTGQVIETLSGMFGAMNGSQAIDADLACTDYADQESAQTAYDADQVDNANLDLDFDGQACEDAFGAGAGGAAGSHANIRALAAVSYQQGDAAGSSVILYIAAPQS